MTPREILIVDDDSALVGMLTELLSGAGFRVRSAASAKQARSALTESGFALAILDRKLPDADGLELCQMIRKDARHARVPVLMLTSAGSTAQRVVGLSRGADDYLAKPFSNEELLARVRALLRRAAPGEDGRRILRVCELELDLDGRRVRCAGKPVELAPKEFDLLEVFLIGPDRVLTRQQLLSSVWGFERGSKVSARSVDVTVSHLREKLPEARRRFVGVTDYGYRFDTGSDP